MKTLGIATATAIVFFVIGMQFSSKKPGTSAHVTIKPSTLDLVAREGRVIVGIGQEAAPFGYIKNDILVGYDVDIARAVTRKLEKYTGAKLRIEFRPISDETRISWVQSGQIHMSLCHTNNTRKRDANIDFTVPYGWDGKSVMYNLKEGKIRDLKDFAGKVIGIKRSSSSEGEIKTFFYDKEWQQPTLRHYDSHIAGIRALVDEQIDGFTDDNSIITNTAVKAGFDVGPGGVLDVTRTPYSPAYFAIGVRENDSDWRDALNYSLHDLWTSGEFLDLYDKWFGPDSMCPIKLGQHHMEPYVDG